MVDVEGVRNHYGRLSRLYETTLGERLLYADSRRAAIDGLELGSGATVIDIACGTGLDFALLEERIGPSGRIIGVDLTEGMLARAADRVARAGWRNVTLVQGDVTALTREQLVADGVLGIDQAIDAALCTLGMSVIPAWERAWSTMLSLLKPGGRAALMDGSPPIAPTLGTRIVAPLVVLGCRWFAADWTRSPWRLVERDLEQARVQWAGWGYVSAASGVKPRAAGSA